MQITLKIDSKPKYRKNLDIVGLKDYPYRLPADICCNNSYRDLKSNFFLKRLRITENNSHKDTNC